MLAPGSSNAPSYWLLQRVPGEYPSRTPDNEIFQQTPAAGVLGSSLDLNNVKAGPYFIEI
jgi:hypothetical protein